MAVFENCFRILYRSGVATNFQKYTESTYEKRVQFKMQQNSLQLPIKIILN